MGVISHNPKVVKDIHSSAPEFYVATLKSDELTAVVKSAEYAISTLQSGFASGDLTLQQPLAYTWASHGNALRDLGTTASRAAAVHSYDKALELLHGLPPSEELRYHDDLANVWTNRGIALLLENNTASILEGVRCFDRAIELRNIPHFLENHWFRYGLVAGWMNRGDALTRLGSRENLAEAIHSYDEALVLMQTLPVDENPLFRERLAITWMNRGITLQEQNTLVSLTEAAQSFDQAIALLRDMNVAEKQENRFKLACAWVNRGNALLRSSPLQGGFKARLAAKKALALVAHDEEHELMAAEVGFKARHVLCQAIGNLLSEKDLPAFKMEGMISEATDAVDEGMRLGRLWKLKGLNCFRSLVNGLFHFGGRIYQIHQPHFLAEFLLESLDPERSPGASAENAEMHMSAIEAIWLALREIQKEGFSMLNTPRFDCLLGILRELKVAEIRLAELRHRHRPNYL